MKTNVLGSYDPTDKDSRKGDPKLWILTGLVQSSGCPGLRDTTSCRWDAVEQNSWKIERRGTLSRRPSQPDAGKGTSSGNSDVWLWLENRVYGGGEAGRLRP